jgi:hypothetical protein
VLTRLGDLPGDGTPPTRTYPQLNDGDHGPFQSGTSRLSLFGSQWQSGRLSINWIRLLVSRSPHTQHLRSWSLLRPTSA